MFRIKKRKKEAKKKTKMSSTMKKVDKKKKAVSTPPPPPPQTQKPKPLNPYLKKEVNSGKQIQRKQPPPPPEPEPKKKSKKTSSDKSSKSKKTIDKAPQSRVPQLGLANRAELPDGFLRDEYGQVYDPRFGKPPPPRSNLARRDSNVYDYSDYSDDVTVVFSSSTTDVQKVV